MNTERWQMRPLPTNLTPPLTLCITMQLPNDSAAFAAFYNQINGLCNWKLWDRDDAHGGTIIAQTWQRALATLKQCSGEPIPFLQNMEVEEMSILRVDCDCNLYVTCCDGTEKQILTGDQVAALIKGQPGSGAPQPTPGGGQACYQAQLQANGQWLAPVVVNAGDTLDFSDVAGAGWDGAALGIWNCPNGQTFFAGACVGFPGPQSGDPAPTIDHMRLIVNIDGVWYDAFNETITVPSGVVNAPVVVQINDGALNDNAGAYSFQLCVTNNAATTFTHVFDFTINNGGFIIDPRFNLGTWTPGIGWKSTVAGVRSDIVVERAFSTRTFTRVEFDWAFVSGPTGTTDFAIWEDNHTGTILQNYPGDTTGKAIWTGSQSMSGMSFESETWTTDQTIITQLTVTGEGTDPF